jgi:spore coat protein CotH
MTSEVIWSCIYPKKSKLQPEQFAYIQNFVDSMELAIQSEDFMDPEKGYAHYIDVPSFVDYFIHTELSLNADGFKRSAYFYKEKLHKDGTGGKMQAGPVWDYNLAYGNCNFANANNLEAWCFEGSSNNPTPALWQRLLQDPQFRKAVKLRYQELRKGTLSTQHINEFIDRQAELLAQSKDRHFKEYPELLSEDGFSPSAMFAAYRVSSYEEEIAVLKKWISDRLAFLDKNIERFDKDWEPRIQEPVERKMQFPQFPGGIMPFPGF